jgi:hypothetical protein
MPPLSHWQRAQHLAAKEWEPTERVYLHFLMPGDRDAISFLREINSFFKIIGNFFWLICNCIYSAQFIIHFKLHFQDFFYKKNYKIVSSDMMPRLRLGRQAPKNEINIPKPWPPDRGSHVSKPACILNIFCPNFEIKCFWRSFSRPGLIPGAIQGFLSFTILAAKLSSRSGSVSQRVNRTYKKLNYVFLVGARYRNVLPAWVLITIKITPWGRGVVVIAADSEREDRGFESQLGMYIQDYMSLYVTMLLSVTLALCAFGKN